jgi:exonuclease III
MVVLDNVTVPVKFPEITIASQNVLSLNVSSKNSKTDLKILALTKGDSDIIILCDTRLNSRKQSAATHDLIKKFRLKGYSFIHNSKTSSRGVALLIKKSVSWEIHRKIEDPGDNYLIVSITVNNFKFTLGAVYGPNQNDLQFYDALERDILALDNQSVILGGDWNATWSSVPVPNNPDVINMQSIPSKQRSEKILNMARHLSLTDPYRFLYPNKTEFTYVPNAAANKNRSRLDFFLISENIIDYCKNVNIPHNLTSKTFDHKPVEICFRKGQKCKPQKIKDTVVGDPLLFATLRASTIDCYNNHASLNEFFTLNTRNSVSRKIGVILQEIANIKNLRMQIANNNGREEAELLTRRINLMQERIDNIFRELPTLQFFENLDLTAQPDTFFETLAITLKNEALSFQSHFYNSKNATKKSLRDQIKNLKSNYVQNRDIIFDLEMQLSTIVELELKEELSTIKNFERLNDEKITPFFLKLAKKPETNDSLTQITDDNNAPYASDEERVHSIYSFYRDLYSVPSGTDPNPNPDPHPRNPESSIEEFLGDVALEEEVINSKISDEERTVLDAPLTLAELDRSMKKSKLNSAPGIDGISNRFIREFWEFFRMPLFKYTNHCFEKGELTENFRSAKIRLIPKKGDCSKIKNWRPISLLNCFYKIISRVIAERLKLVINRITNVGQKGYNSAKYCQEVLITLIDEIETAKTERRNGALLSLDIRKAFDTISHNFINKCYKFFNFGDNFIKWLNLIGTNRKACIILENNMYSNFFNLERGNAQGDTTSPYIFNIGYQILLFKLNFDLQIAGLIVPPEVPPDVQPPGQQVRTKPRKTFAFADDATLAIRLDFNTLLRIKKILTDFGKLSGLECNVEKTVLMPIGLVGPIPANILDLGFSIKDDITVLGLKLSNNFNNFDEQWDSTFKKVRNQVNHWSRFNLSLPGRISIAKCMMYSQINYLGCILPIPKIFADRISMLIEDFVTGNIQIAKKRLYLSTDNGGLGLFEINDFLDSQKVSWITRASNLDEIWKIRLFVAGEGNIYNIRSCLINPSLNPVLYNIAKAYERFLAGYTKHNENFWECPIFENKALFASLRQKTPLTREFFDAEFFEINKKRIFKLKISDFFVTKNSYKSWEDFKNITGLDINRELFNSLKKIASNAKLKYEKKISSEKKTTELSDYLNRKVKGCKRYRKKITGTEEKNIPHNIVKFASNTETVIGYDDSKKLNSVWASSVLSNSARTFLFKLHNNTAGYNSAVAHFVHGHSPNCTFCDVVENQEVESETPLHLFYSCLVSERFVEEIFSWILGAPANVTRQEFFVSFNRPDHRKNEVLFLLSALVKKYMWDCKQRFSLPNIQNAKIFLREEMKIITFCSGKARQMFLNSGISLQEG